MFKNLLYKKDVKRYGVGGERLESCDRFGKTFISLVGFIKEHDITGLQFSAVSILKDDTMSIPAANDGVPRIPESSSQPAAMQHQEPAAIRF